MQTLQTIQAVLTANPVDLMYVFAFVPAIYLVAAIREAYVILSR